MRSKLTLENPLSPNANKTFKYDSTNSFFFQCWKLRIIRGFGAGPPKERAIPCRKPRERENGPLSGYFFADLNLPNDQHKEGLNGAILSNLLTKWGCNADKRIARA
jgi:hypothetical protein